MFSSPPTRSRFARSASCTTQRPSEIAVGGSDVINSTGAQRVGIQAEAEKQAKARLAIVDTYARASIACALTLTFDSHNRRAVRDAITLIRAARITQQATARAFEFVFEQGRARVDCQKRLESLNCKQKANCAIQRKNGAMIDNHSCERAAQLCGGGSVGGGGTASSSESNSAAVSPRFR